MSEASEEAPKYTVKPDGADPYATWLTRELKHDRGLLASRYDASGRYVFVMRIRQLRASLGPE